MPIYHNSPGCQPILAFASKHIILLKPKDKRPVYESWTTDKPSINGDARAYLDLGYNLGYLIPDNCLVIDVDPRNGGLQSYSMLPDEVRSLPATTITAGGGFHVYTTLPDGTDAKTLKSKLKAYPGIDFLHKGRQVVLPGSTLESGLGWRVGPLAEFPPPAAPGSLLELLTRSAPASGPVNLDTYLSIYELDMVLMGIPPNCYRDNDSWLQLAMACHHATNGQGLPAFLAWSTSDPQYADHGDVISARWESMDTGNTEAPVTIRTLLREVGKYAPVPPWLITRAGLTTSPEEFFGKLEAGKNDTQNALNELSEEISLEGDHTTLLTTLPARIGLDSRLTESMRDILLKKIAKKTGGSLPSIKKDVKLMLSPKITSFEVIDPTEQDVDAAQPHTQAAQTAIISLSKHGVPPAFCFGRWLTWNEHYWSSETSDIDVNREAHKALYNQGTHATSTAIGSVVGVMRTLMEVPSEAFTPSPDTVTIYTRFHVLRFKGGRWAINPPGAENRNLTILNAVYKEDAPKPVTWLRFLGEVTVHPQAIRAIACSIIYAAADCRPWLRRAVYLFGPKRSGKSTLLNAIQDILGDHNCSSLSLRQLSSKHGPASLVGNLANISNEAMSSDTLRDDVFKSLVSGETINVEEKFKALKSYTNTTKLFFAANSFPRVTDESDATWDRLAIISCPNTVPEETGDTMLGEKLREERDSIFKWAMDIFAAEYVRDRCVSAMTADPDGDSILRRWKEVNSPVLRWYRERTLEGENESMSVTYAYNDYKQWCHDCGHKALNKIHFSRQVGSRARRETINSVKVFMGISLSPVESSNFNKVS